jgi:hypothetical protein
MDHAAALRTRATSDARSVHTALAHVRIRIERKCRSAVTRLRPASDCGGSSRLLGWTEIGARARAVALVADRARSRARHGDERDGHGKHGSVHGRRRAAPADQAEIGMHMLVWGVERRSFDAVVGGLRPRDVVGVGMLGCFGLSRMLGVVRVHGGMHPRPRRAEQPRQQQQQGGEPMVRFPTHGFIGYPRLIHAAKRRGTASPGSSRGWFGKHHSSWAAPRRQTKSSCSRTRGERAAPLVPSGKPRGAASDERRSCAADSGRSGRCGDARFGGRGFRA